ncbi:MAG: thioredoxin domain-containing protein [Thaumarchaeota archaeon]|nr:thioredoxin domain-containing protein [Nitrososphaerota archaeon]
MPGRHQVKNSGGKRKFYGVVVVLIAIIGAALGYVFLTNPTTQEVIIPLSFSNQLGSDDAPITILEFGEYQCPSCGAFFRNTKAELVAKYVDTGIVKMYFRDYAYYGPDSTSASIAARCAGEQGKYWEFHDFAFSMQGPINSGWASPENLKGFAQAIELDTEAFNNCLDSDRYSDEVANSYADGFRRGVRGTPTFIIIGPDGREAKLVGAQPFQAFERIIESILSR